MKDNIITKVRGVCLVRGLFSLLCAAAVFFTACEFNFDKRPEGLGGELVPVEAITGVPTSSIPYVALGLTATVEPHNATNKRIEWSITNDGGTQSSIDGSRLTANAEGTVTVTARIENGLADGVDYTENFHIVIVMVSPYKVEDITNIPAYLPIGDYTYTLRGKITPDNTTYRDIVWSVIDQGGTGATVTPAGFLSAARKGTVTLRATIANGLLEDGDYTQDFPILITRGVIASGRNHALALPKACYWVDGVYNELNNASVYSAGHQPGLYTSRYISTTAGIVEVDGKLYIAGSYAAADNYTNVCYWVDGVEQPALPDSTGSNNTGTYSYSIAAGGGFVYILGRVRGESCYWKINANTGAAEKITLKNPDGTAHTSLSIADSQYASDTLNYYISSNMAVTNDGRVIVGYSGNDSSSDGIGYWDSNNIVGNSITAVKITALDSYSNLRLNSVGIVNGEVYLAGSALNPSFNLNMPYYYRLATGGYSVMNIPPPSFVTTLFEVNSIIDQNGSPVFYGYNNGLYYFDTEWHITYEREHFFAVESNRIVYSDGDVYVPFERSVYMVLREPFPIRSVELVVGVGSAAENPVSQWLKGGYITGLVVR